MRKQEIEMLYAYLLNYQTILEEDVAELRQTVRLRPVDPVDCMELALSLERKNCFVEFSKNVRAILHLTRGAEMEKEDKEDGNF